VQPDGKCTAFRALFAASRAFIRPRNIVIACAATEERKKEEQHPQGISYINPLSEKEGEEHEEDTCWRLKFVRT